MGGLNFNNADNNPKDNKLTKQEYLADLVKRSIEDGHLSSDALNLLHECHADSGSKKPKLASVLDLLKQLSEYKSSDTNAPVYDVSDVTESDICGALESAQSLLAPKFQPANFRPQRGSESRDRTHR
jgi:hypothetical protein